ncbi:MAG TPA: spherulation-specific family 4 protein [Pseudonocardiaceae bacterium]|nr:spherulation-specific family 4 protein [Pseudonocardiaceae bacterium]
MRVRWTIGLLAGAAVIVGLSAIGSGLMADAGGPTGIPQHVAVPAYLDPTTGAADWTELIGSTDRVSLLVANVNNGPTSAVNPGWANVIGRAHRAGITVIGYVDTGYLGTTGLATRSGPPDIATWTAQIESDVDGWYRLYGNDMGGIFFDQAQNRCGPAAASTVWSDAYRTLTDYVKHNHPGAITVSNPGTVVPQCYQDAADVLVTFEGSYAAYTGHPAAGEPPYTAPGWNPSSPTKFWHIVYDAPNSSELEQAIGLAKTRGAGYVYVTPATMPNPYDRIPPADYWADEQNHVG